MAGLAVLVPTGPVAGVGYIRMRDHILIDKTLKKKFEDVLGVITLVAREIEHAPGINLNLPGRRIIIVADHYDAKGCTINVSGTDGPSGATGATGAAGLATAHFNRPGGTGTKGVTGDKGENAGSIRIVVQRLGDVRLVAKGGAGGRGGDGGSGGCGGDGRGATSIPMVLMAQLAETAARGAMAG
jgi:hypothetical protein